MFLISLPPWKPWARWRRSFLAVQRKKTTARRRVDVSRRMQAELEGEESWFRSRALWRRWTWRGDRRDLLEHRVVRCLCTLSLLIPRMTATTSDPSRRWPCCRTTSSMPEQNVISISQCRWNKSNKLINLSHFESWNVVTFFLLPYIDMRPVPQKRAEVKWTR